MIRALTVFGWVSVFASGLLAQAAAQGLPGGVIPRVPLRRHGLERAWVVQTDVVPGRSGLASLTLRHGMLLVQTDVGLLQALDAETGKTLWRAQVGNRNYDSVPPGMDDHFVAVANGSTLYILSRSDGRLRWDWPLDSAPTAGLAVGNNRVYAPTVVGRVESYLIGELKEGAIVPTEPGQGKSYYGVSGIPQTACLVTPDAIVVGTSSGSLYGFVPGVVGPRYRVETDEQIIAKPAYYNRRAIVGSRDAYVYSINELNGDIVWRASLGDPINQSPVVIKDAIYVVTQSRGLFQLAADSGDERWFAPGIAQFVAAGANRIYAADKLGSMQVLDATTGRRVDTLRLESYPILLSNTENDRIYLASAAGLLHCLRESALVEPLVYRTVDAPSAAATQQQPASAPTAEKAADEAAPPAPAEKAADDELGGFGDE